MSKKDYIPDTVVIEPRKNEFKEIYDYIAENSDEEGRLFYDRLAEDFLHDGLGISRSIEWKSRQIILHMVEEGIIALKEYRDVLGGDETALTKYITILKEWDEIE